MRVLRFILPALLFGTPALAGDMTALHDGESYTFRVSWGPFFGAGDVNLTAAQENNDGVSRLRITTRTSTRGVIRVLFPFDGTGDSFFDTRDGRTRTPMHMNRR